MVDENKWIFFSLDQTALLDTITHAELWRNRQTQGT